jgi:xylose isomerase
MMKSYFKNVPAVNLESYALKLKEVEISSGRQEYLENLINGLLFG